MRELGFTFYPTNGINVYKISVDELKILANKKKWLHELDIDEMNDIQEDIENELDIDIQKEVHKQHCEKQEYEKQIKELKEQLLKFTTPPEKKKSIKKKKKNKSDDPDAATLFEDLEF